MLANCSYSYNLTMDGVAKEMAAANSNTASNEEGNRPFVEQFECEVVYRDLAKTKNSLGGVFDDFNLCCHHGIK